MGSTITLNKERIVQEDLEVGLGTVEQNRGVGTKINADSIPYTETETIKDILDASYLKDDVDALLATKASLNGDILERFKVALGVDPEDTVQLQQLESLLALKADVADLIANYAINSSVLLIGTDIPFGPTLTYDPATKKYVDDAVILAGAADMTKAVYDTTNNGIVDLAEGIGSSGSYMGISSDTQIMRNSQNTIADCNSVLAVGIFTGTGVTNSPTSGDILVENHIIGNVKVQSCFSKTTGKWYYRHYTTLWSPWKTVLDSDDLTTINSAIALKADTAVVDTKAPIDSPTFTGVPAGPTPVAGTNTTQFATTEFVDRDFVKPTDYATSTVGGTIKARYDSGTQTLYITTDGTDA